MTPGAQRFKLADAREFLPGGALHKYLLSGPLAGARAAEVNALFAALGAPLPEALPIESGPELPGQPQLVLGELLAVELRGPELWGEARFFRFRGGVPLSVAAFGLTIAFRYDGRSESGALQVPRLLYAFPASGPRDPALYPGVYEEGPRGSSGELAS